MSVMLRDLFGKPATREMYYECEHCQAETMQRCYDVDYQDGRYTDFACVCNECGWFYFALDSQEHRPIGPTDWFTVTIQHLETGLQSVHRVEAETPEGAMRKIRPTHRAIWVETCDENLAWPGLPGYKGPAVEPVEESSDVW